MYLKRMQTISLAAALAVLACGACPAASETNGPSPSKSYLMAYESMSTADWLLKRGMKEDAAALYEESIRLYRKLASDYPAWETNLVDFRIHYCVEGLARALKAGDAAEDPRGVPIPKAPAPAVQAAPVPGPVKPAPESDKAAGLEQAMALEKKSDFESALEQYRMALAGSPKDSAALAGAGRCYLRLGQVDRARDLLFQWSVVPAPDNAVNMLLAVILCHDRQFDRALQLAGIIVADDPAGAAARVILGVALAGTGQIDQGMAEMQKAISLNPRLSEAHYNLARLLIKKDPKQKATAGEHYANALKFGAAPDPALAKLLDK